jgi:hypothetical protein
MSTASRDTLIAELQKVIAGLKLHNAGQTLQLGGTAVKVDDLIAVFEAFIVQIAGVDAAHAAWLAKADAAKATETTQITPPLQGLKAWLTATLGSRSPTLVDYGLTPKKPIKRTVAAKAQTAEKSAATRVARHTLGPRQKAGIHGSVPPAPQSPSTKPPKGD